jgi:transcriptional regulator with XRE-family HTH domain
MSQATLGRALGVTFQQVQKYENGSNRVGASTLFRVATALGMPLDYFFKDMPASAAKLKSKSKSKSKSKGLSDKKPAYSADPMASREAIQLVNNYFRIGDGDIRRQLFQFVKSVSRKKTGK